MYTEKLLKTWTTLSLLIFLANTCIGQTSLELEVDRFWNDTKKEEIRLSELHPQEVTDHIYGSLNEIVPGVYVEISENEGPKRYEILLSANGDTGLFEDIKLICDRAPELDRFSLQAFRQSEPDYPGIEVGPLKLLVKEMYFAPMMLDGKLGIEVYVTEQDENVDFDMIYNYGSIVIDKVAGEALFAEKVHTYDFYFLPVGIELSQLSPISELKDYLMAVE